MVGALLMLSGRPSGALTIRGDELWRSNNTCPDGWTEAAADDATWPHVTYPWPHIWPKNWLPDPLARVFWGHEPSSNTCVRRHFQLDALPSGRAVAHIWVDDDYDFYLNGTFVGASHD